MLSRRTISRLRKIKAKILEEPNQFDMFYWRKTNNVRFVLGATACNTTHCIGGWGILLFKPKSYIKNSCGGIFPKNRTLSTGELASKALGLTYRQSVVLFHHNSWPKIFMDRYLEAVTPLEQTQVAAEYIDSFINHRSRA